MFFRNTCVHSIHCMVLSVIDAAEAFLKKVFNLILKEGIHKDVDR